MTEGSELPTRDDVWRVRSAENEFPSQLVAGARSAVAFFAAHFFGRNDVVFLDHLGVSEIVLVDKNSDNMDHMAKIYPSVVETIAEDAYAVANRMRAAGRTFDVVTCDPFTNDGWPIVTDHFETFGALARRTWITGVTVDEFTKAGVTPTVDGVQAWLNSDGHEEWEAAWLADRNPSTHLMWLGLRRRNPLA
jgi:hypothetical protein